MKDVVRTLRRLIPQLMSATCPKKGPDLCDTLAAVQFVRNTIIHQRGVIDPVRLNRLPKDGRRYVQSMVKVSGFHGGSRLLPSEAQVRDALFTLCVLANTIYEHASVACGMSVEYRPSEN